MISVHNDMDTRAAIYHLHDNSNEKKFLQTESKDFVAIIQCRPVIR